ncbi:Body wall muscle HR-29 [Brachionus plicatilis]|uniref:Body wall muscle HR-29 n=1 Tax=Brachionus plicatilis TaxID=10195 RepID=A0A3M7PPS7_BRAPC|nr:Body wall muscle HR-29 [Brachionus plicatilis]
MRNLSLLKNTKLIKASNFQCLGPHVFRKFSISTSTNRMFFGHHDPFEDRFFGLASNLMRNLEREFDNTKRQFEKTMNLLPPNYLPSLIRPKALESNIVRMDNEGNRSLQIEYDLSDFEPEEVKIKTHGHTLKIKAKKEQKSDKEYSLKEFAQSFTLPKELKLEDLKSRWSDDGILIIEAPLPKMVESKKKERVIPIEHGEEKNITEGAEAAGKKASEYAGTETNLKS